MVKILVIRLSSIGDIVLTTPVIRCLKEQGDDYEVHTLTKPQYSSIYKNNPHVDEVHEWGADSGRVLKKLKQLRFDYVIDLHRNIRTQKIKSALKTNSHTFPKLNVQKWLYVNFKVNRLPDIHIVDRYFEAVKELGIVNDNKGLDFFIDDSAEVLKDKLTGGKDYICFAIGAQFNTKKLPPVKLAEIIKELDKPIVIIGGKEDKSASEELSKLLTEKQIINTTGTYSIEGSASIVKQAKVLVTHDTGMMHIAAAFDVPIVSIWGNTVPDFGMYPYRPKNKSSYTIHEVKTLPCRPCSKIGFQKCPKKHFKCMMDQDVNEIVSSIADFGNEYGLN